MKKVIYTLLLSAAIALPSYASTSAVAPAPAVAASAINTKAEKIRRKRDGAVVNCTHAANKAKDDLTAANLSGNWKMLADTYLGASERLKDTLTALGNPDNKHQVRHLEAACKKSAKEVEGIVKHAPKTPAAPMSVAKKERLTQRRADAIEHCTKEIEKVTTAASAVNLSGNWKTLSDAYLTVANSFKKALNDLAAPDNKAQIRHLSAACHDSAREVGAIAAHAPKAAATTPVSH